MLAAINFISGNLPHEHQSEHIRCYATACWFHFHGNTTSRCIATDCTILLCYHGNEINKPLHSNGHVLIDAHVEGSHILPFRRMSVTINTCGTMYNYTALFIFMRNLASHTEGNWGRWEENAEDSIWTLKKVTGVRKKRGSLHHSPDIRMVESRRMTLVR
jgi:hypothetical protein